VWRELGHTKAEFVALAKAAPRVDEAALEVLEQRWFPTAAPEAIDETPPLSDLGNAQLFVAEYIDKLRFCPPMKKFLVWGDARWARDETFRAQAFAQNLVRKKLIEAASAIPPDPKRVKHFLRSQTDNRIDAILTLARPALIVMPDQLDQVPDLLNFRNGTLDLRSGKLQSHQQGNYITKLVSYNYNPDAPCPLWRRFLN